MALRYADVSMRKSISVKEKARQICPLSYTSTTTYTYKLHPRYSFVGYSYTNNQIKLRTHNNESGQTKRKKQARTAPS